MAAHPSPSDRQGSSSDCSSCSVTHFRNPAPLDTSLPLAETGTTCQHVQTPFQGVSSKAKAAGKQAAGRSRLGRSRLGRSRLGKSRLSVGQARLLCHMMQQPAGTKAKGLCLQGPLSPTATHPCVQSSGGPGACHRHAKDASTEPPSRAAFR